MVDNVQVLGTGYWVLGVCMWAGCMKGCEEKECNAHGQSAGIEYACGLHVVRAPAAHTPVGAGPYSQASSSGGGSAGG
jgi:hypothetical protein